MYGPTEPSQPMMNDDVSDGDRPQQRELRPLLPYFVIAFVGIFLVQLFVRCTSYVGRTGNRQMLSLARGCWYTSTVAHEIGGFYMTDFMKHGTLREYFIFHIK